MGRWTRGVLRSWTLSLGGLRDRDRSVRNSVKSTREPVVSMGRSPGAQRAPLLRSQVRSSHGFAPVFNGTRVALLPAMRAIAPIVYPEPPRGRPIRHAANPGQANIAVAWCMIALSLMGGAVLGLWSFYGPLTPPAGFEHYAATPRRLIRLAHIASVMLPVLNLLYVPLLGTTGLLLRTRILGCRLLLVGTVLLPLTLAARGILAARRVRTGPPGQHTDHRVLDAGLRAYAQVDESAWRDPMRIGLIAMSGVRVKTEELVELGVTLPGFVRRGQVIASLPSLGLFTLAGMTPGHHELTYLEVDELPAEGELPDFDLVGISSFTARIDDAYRLADRYRSRGVRVVMGGLHVSMLPDEALEHADAVVTGGAEGAWPQLLEDAEAGTLARRYDGARNAVFADPLYTFPRYDLLRERAYNRVTVQTSRGCPRRCEFCAASLRITSRFNQKPVDRVIAEIREARRHVDEPFFEFADDNTFIDRRWSRELLRRLQREEIRYFTETDVSVAEDPELCDLLAASGCRQVLIGLESPRASDLGGLDPVDWKARQVPKMMRAIDVLQSRGVSVNGCFILGLDSHTPEIFHEVLEFVRNSGLAEVQYTVLDAVPRYTALRPHASRGPSAAPAVLGPLHPVRRELPPLRHARGRTGSGAALVVSGDLHRRGDIAPYPGLRPSTAGVAPGTTGGLGALLLGLRQCPRHIQRDIEGYAGVVAVLLPQRHHLGEFLRMLLTQIVHLGRILFQVVQLPGTRPVGLGQRDDLPRIGNVRLHAEQFVADVGICRVESGGFPLEQRQHRVAQHGEHFAAVELGVRGFDTGHVEDGRHQVADMHECVGPLAGVGYRPR